MEERTIFKFLVGVASLFILFSFNKILLLNISNNNIANILMAVVIFMNLILIFKQKSKNVKPYEYLLFITTFMAGINVQIRAKLFIFLIIVYLIYTIYCTIGIVKKVGNFMLPIILSSLALTISIFAFIALKINMAAIIFLIVPVLLLGIHTASIVFLKKDKV